MSRYRVTERELLEQVRHEGRMKDIYTMAFDGDKAETIAKKLKLDIKTVKKVLGERFTKADFDDNEDNNEHSKNAFELAKLYGTPQEKAQMKAIMHRNQRQGYTSSSDNRIVTSIQAKYYSRLREETELKEFNPDFGKDTRAGRTKETHADNKKTKDEDRIKSLENEIQRLKLELENEKNATVKPEPNPDTGEVPLTVGIAHKYLKDKQEKEKVKKEELELNERAYRIKFDNVDGAIGNKEADTVQAQLRKMGMGASVSLSDPIEYKSRVISSKNELYFNTGVEKDQMKRALKKLGYDLKEELEEAVLAGRDYKYDGIGPIKISKKMYAKVQRDSKGKDFSGKPYMLALNPKTQETEMVPVKFEEVELNESDDFYATIYSKDPKIVSYITTHKKDLTYVDTDAGNNIEFEGRGAHALADKIKAKFGVKIKKESFTMEDFENDTSRYMTEKIKGLENKAKKSGMPYSILKKVYDRGMAAWKGGHRPGATQQQWAFARVNSFVTKSSGTWGKADKDLADKVRASKKEDVDLEEATFSPAMLSQLKKAYGNLKTITPSNATKLNKILDTVTKDGLIDLYKAKIPFVSIGAGGKLSQKHNLSPKDINRIISKEEVELDELQNYSRQLKDPSKEMMVVDKQGKVSVIDKKEFEKYKRQGYMPAESVEENGPCWKTHKQVGMKKKNGRMVPNCVPKEELDKDDKPVVKKVIGMLKKASKKHAAQSKMLDKAVNEADLTDKQVKMVRKVADKLPKDDFKKRYGKDADNVKFGTATNIVKKKLKIDEYEGARALVDRLLKQEKGDE